MSGKNPARVYAKEYVGGTGLTTSQAASVAAAVLAATPAADATGTVFGDVAGGLLGPLMVQALHGDEASAALTADADDYDLGDDKRDAFYWLIDFAGFDISGFAAPGTPGELHCVVNTGTAGSILVSGSGSAAENQVLSSAGDVAMATDAAVLIGYSGTLDRWVLLGGAGSSSATDGMVPYYLGAGEAFTVPVYKQALFADAIELDGDAELVVEGELIEVDAPTLATIGGLFQPLDSDLTAIAALSTTTYGRALLTLADAAAGRTALGLGSAATQSSAAFDAAGAAAAAAAASQPLDSDLTAIAALTTTAFGRGLLALASAALTASGFTMSTARLLGRTTAATGAVEEISIGAGLTFAGGVLSGATALTVEEVDGSPTDSAITKIVFPNDTVSIAAHVATVRAVGGTQRVTAVQGSDISLAAAPTQTTILDLVVPAGVWTILATFRVYAASGAAMHIYPELFDVTNATSLASGTEIIAANNYYREMVIQGDVTLTAPATIRLRASGDNAGAHAIGGGNSIRMTAIPGNVTGAMSLAAGRADLTAGNVTTSSTAFVDAAGLSVTAVTGARRCLVTLQAVGFVSSGSVTPVVTLLVDGVNVGDATWGFAGVTSAGGDVARDIVFLTDVLTAGSHTFKIQFKSNAAGTVGIYGGNTGGPKASLAVHELPDAIPVTGAVSQTIRGEVSGAGAVTRGTGFTAARTSLGHYTITFTSAFAAIPVVVGSAIDVNVSVTGHPYNPSTGAVDFMCAEPNVAFRDAPFTFIAMSTN